MANLGNVTYYGQKSFEDQLTQNLLYFLQYGLLEVGAYYNIRKGQNDYLGNNASQLKEIDMPGVPDNRYFQTLKNNIVWESGISYAFTPPTNGEIINVSGIYYQDTFYSLGSSIDGTGWRIDYPRGMVVFDNPIGTGKIEMEHTLRVANILTSDNPGYKKIINKYMTRENWAISGSGLDNTDINVRSYIPCVSIHISNMNSIPMEIGSRNKWVRGVVDFEILAANSADRKRLTDLIYLLEDKSFKTFNINECPQTFNVSGSIYSGTLTWKDLTEQYYMGNARFMGGASIVIPNNTALPLEYSRVRMNIEMPVYYIN